MEVEVEDEPEESQESQEEEVEEIEEVEEEEESESEVEEPKEEALEDKKDESLGNKIINKFVSDLTELIELGSGEENKHYFSASSLGKGDEFKCEIAFIHDKELKALDLKAHILMEEIKWQGDDGDNSQLTDKINDYISSISSPEYLESVTSSIPEGISYDSSSILIAVKNYEQLDILKRVAQDFDFAKFNIEVKIFNDINDLFL